MRYKHRAKVTVVLAFAVVGISLIAAENQRIAKVIDSRGTETLVSELYFSWDDPVLMRGVFDFRSDSAETIVVDTGLFHLGVPLDSLSSVVFKNAKDRSGEVRYRLKNGDQTITGRIENAGSFHGKSDLGEFAIEATKVREISYATPGVAKDTQEPTTFDARLVLADCASVPVADLARFTEYCDSSGYIVGCGHVWRRYKDVRFPRGESLVTIPFSNIETILFGGDKSSPPQDWSRELKGTVTVTLKNGKQAAGILTGETAAGAADAQILGFTGIYEKGEFFLPARYVKAIVFGQSKAEVECVSEPPKQPKSSPKK